MCRLCSPDVQHTPWRCRTQHTAHLVLIHRGPYRCDSAAVLEKLPAVPDAQGRFGKFGGRYVPETLIFALEELQQAYTEATEDPEFQVPNYLQQI